MGMDGLSMANTGMLREATSRDYAIQTEEHVIQDDMNKQVGKLSTQMKVKEDGHNGGDAQEKENKDKRYEKTFFVRNDAPLAALVGAERQRPQL